mgnify:CR=1 FL=1
MRLACKILVLSSFPAIIYEIFRITRLAFVSDLCLPKILILIYVDILLIVYLIVALKIILLD